MQKLHPVLARAIQEHQAGQLDRAQALYLEVLAQQPDHAQALNLMGYLARQRGDLPAAIDWIRKAIAAAPRDARYSFSLAETLRAAGRLPEAIEAYHASLRIDSRAAPAWHALGIALEALERRAEAVAAFQQALAIDLRLVPAHESLAASMLALGLLAEAQDACRRGLSVDPNRPLLHAHLGAVLIEQRDFPAAMAAYERAAQLAPNWPPPHVAIADVLLRLGLPLESQTSARRAIALDPGFAAAHNALGVALERQGRFSEAQVSFEQAIALQPGDARALSNLAMIRLNELRQNEAVELLGRAVAAAPASIPAHDLLLSALNYAEGPTPAEVFEEHRRWAAAHAAQGIAASAYIAAGSADERPLRVGYVSPDFREHPVAHFMEPVLAGHDRGNVCPIIYSDATQPDSVTQRLRNMIAPADWHDVHGVADDALATMIRGHGIDILVDLAGHTAANRLLVFSRKPAAVQVTYLGYPNTSGLPQSIMQYRLTDAYCDPPDQMEIQDTEQLYRLKPCFLCFAPSTDLPEVGPAAFGKRGVVTFGSFNAMAKLTPHMLDLWAQILQRVPDARLMLKNKAMGDPGLREKLRQALAARNISSDRLDLLAPERTHRQHVGRYLEMDIALDTFPYHGTTTTCDALWMGVPVVTLAGEVHRARVGVSLLSNLGLESLVADSPGNYVELALALANDPARIDELRKNLRDRMRASPLMNCASFVKELENAYRSISHERSIAFR